MKSASTVFIPYALSYFGKALLFEAFCKHPANWAAKRNAKQLNSKNCWIYDNFHPNIYKLNRYSINPMPL